MKNNIKFLIITFIVSSHIVLGQTTLDSISEKSTDSTLIMKEYTSLEEALIFPEKVYRLNLSNQSLSVSNLDWSKFKNLTYLSFKNDHLKEIPPGIGNLQYLKVLDLTGNDFIMLPSSISKLKNLEELFLNDEKYFRIDENIETLSLLPKLRILHLENDHLEKLPKKLKNLNHLEILYLNNNDFKLVPKEVIDLKSLKYLDIQNNQIAPTNFQEFQNQGFGIKIKF